MLERYSNVKPSSVTQSRILLQRQGTFIYFHFVTETNVKPSSVTQYRIVI